MSIMPPTEAKNENPTCALTAQSSIPVPSAALCEMSAMSPRAGCRLRSDAFSPTLGRITPRRVGTENVHRVARAACA